ncbi:RNA-binding cell elongation regulator Jag/EloR [Alteribacillus sp. HJP-4]|uniref:RNA-binding cell elongation regulator Jag/EloR n=1 Tax=Alteribacillus sp. HJP-4 TaxID=2775394 RepID=UPI0035CD104F
MKTVKISGKTVDEAISLAMQKLEVNSQEEIEYEVLDQGSKGFFGIIGFKPAVIEAAPKIDPVEEAAAFLRQVILDMQVDVDIELINKGRETEFQLIGKDIGVLIGKRGKTLDSLQYLVNLVANRNSDKYARIILDAENYRERRQEALEHLADRLADKARRTGRKVVLEPMNARERKIIHTALQNSTDIETYSDGTEPRRHVVIALRNQ